MPTTIEVFSDFVCPFCYLAEQPLADAVEGSDVRISWQPFELRPEPTPTLRPEGEYLQSTWQQVVYPMAERMGVPIVLPRISPQPYSRLAFEGFAYAAERDVGQRYTEQVFRAFFVHQRDIGQPDVLTDVAAQLELDADDFRAALDSGRYAAVHQRALHRAHELNITVVPTILVEGHRLEGMPSARALHQLINGAVALRQADWVSQSDVTPSAGVALPMLGNLACMDDLSGFVLARLADDERRLEAGELPHLDEAERRGRLRIMRTDDQQGLLLVAGPVEAREERVPIPYPEKAAFLRQEVHREHDEAMLGLVASVYDAHPDWQEDWRP